MRILFICQYYPPEMGAPSARTFEHACQWVADGHDITVLTSFPSHPTGVVPPEFRGKIFQREEADGIRVWRSWHWATRNEGFLKRTLSYVSFMLSAIVAATFHPARYDAVVATSPQFFVAIAGYVISRMKRKPFILEIRDLWPEAIVSVGLLEPDALITRVLERIELFLYRKADCIIPVTEGARDDMIRRGIDPDKIHTVRNGANLTHFAPGPRENAVRERFGLGDKFVAAYVGTHGMAHGLDGVLDAADRLREREDIHFLFVGEGAEKPKLVALAEERQLPNMTFVDPQPKAMVPLFLCAADACLVPLRRHKLFEGTIPSKIFEAMASGRPILLGVQGEAERILTDAEAGIPVEPENPAALANGILRLADDPGLGRELGESGVNYVRTHFDRSVLARKMMEILVKYAARDAGGASSAGCP